MYLFFSRALYFRTAVLCILLFCAVGKGYGQRIYADDQQHSDPVKLLFATLAEVRNPVQAVDENNLTNNSELSAILGALSLIQAWQNLQFTKPSILKKPLKTSPVYIKIASTDLLTLVKGIIIQPTSNKTLVGNTTTNNTLLDVLGLLGNGIEEIRIIPNISYDGVRILIDSQLLAALITLKLYYAFIIESPDIDDQDICSGQSVNLLIKNFQSGYSYKWYDAEVGGNLIQTTTSNKYTTPTLNSSKTYYVEAIESGNDGYYYSGRSPVTVTVNPKPGVPKIEAK